MTSDSPALRRAIAILRHLASGNRPISAGALSRSLDIPRSSTYELLAVLDEQGLVAKAETGYMLGAGVAELGSAYSRANPLQRLAQPMLVKLAEATSGTAQLAVLRGWETIYIAKEQAVSSVAIITATGVRMPAYLTATGRAMMAGLSRREVLALLSGESSFVNRTGVGPRNVRELNAELAASRTRGFALERGEITPGVVTVAAAVLDAVDRPVAAVGLSVQERDVRDLGAGQGRDVRKPGGGLGPGAAEEALESLGTRVQDVARRLSRRLR
ncbi:IclR family transcriptional regulator [Brevibacterium moorei]|uniref:IclR family transcriptional regulator n=1 Tax=Brevibacterium moorei TaxID=2968457 RepID=UPI00211C7D78|nr:IclR family transcriptional regulator [Brevibacterium sp. 68QC2CO]MCQ9386150.1 IclR family transcriptional regulator [Brevibacterium sp. 68QC2CO]